MSNPLADFTTGDLVSYYAEYRRQVDAITAEADAKLAKPKKMLAALEGELLRRAAEEDVKAFPCNTGTFSLLDTRRYSVSDPVAWQNFIFKEQDLSYLGKSLTKSAVEEYEKTHGELPPGVGTHVQRTIRFTPSKK